LCLSQKLDQSAQLGRDAIGDKEQPDFSGVQVLFDALPEALDIGIWHIGDQRLHFCFDALATALCRVCRCALQPFHVPMCQAVGGVVEHRSRNAARRCQTYNAPNGAQPRHATCSSALFSEIANMV